jgi:hypothetical protein
MIAEKIATAMRAGTYAPTVPAARAPA